MIQTSKQTRELRQLEAVFLNSIVLDSQLNTGQLQPLILNDFILPNAIGGTMQSGLSLYPSTPASSSLGLWLYLLPLILTTGWSGNSIFKKKHPNYQYREGDKMK